MESFLLPLTKVLFTSVIPDQQRVPSQAHRALQSPAGTQFNPQTVRGSAQLMPPLHPSSSSSWWKKTQVEPVQAFPKLSASVGLLLRLCSVPAVFTPRVIGTAVARYNFAARDMRELSLREGDVVKIYSRIGGDQGWWKGETNGRVSAPRQAPVPFLRWEILPAVRMAEGMVCVPHFLFPWLWVGWHPVRATSL